MTTINHYTITTGHNRVSPRSEVSDDVIAALRPMLRTGEHAMPGGFDGYRVRVTIEGSVLAATVSHVVPGVAVPLVTMLAVRDAEGLARAVRVTGAIPASELTAPAVLVEVHASASGNEALDWLGDFERCLAWAWIEAAS